MRGTANARAKRMYERRRPLNELLLRAMSVEKRLELSRDVIENHK